MVSITSEELNYIVFRYLHESGFTHSAFAFGYEAGITKNTIDGNLVPPGALVTFIQKGLQYLELEANLTSDDVDVDGDVSFLQPLDLITKDVSELQKIVQEKKKNLIKDKSDTKKMPIIEEINQEVAQGKEKGRRGSKEKEEAVQEKEKGKRGSHEQEEVVQEKERGIKVSKEQEDVERIDRDRAQKKTRVNEKPNQDLVDTKDGDEKGMAEQGEAGTSGVGPEPMETSPTCSVEDCGEFLGPDVTILEGHTSEVFACAWSPSASLLASGSGDSTARIWTIADGSCSSNMQSGLANAVVLKHVKGKYNEKSQDVTTLDWNGEGTLLATGSYDGQARVWSKDGELKNTLIRHRGPIFALKWNKKGDYLLTGSVDKTAIVWDVKTGEWKQQFEFSAPTLDVDWKNNVSFATCSTNNMIHVCKIGENQPIKAFSGHQGEVNAIKWDPTGSLLASCSDDCTAKIWSLKQDNHLHDFKEHSKEIYTIRWSPTGPGTENPNQQLLLASASFDSTIKLWDVEVGTAVSSLNGHRDPVYSVAFSPDGQYLASGSLDRCVHIWSVKEGRIVKTYNGKGGIFEVCWKKEGDKIAACFANNVVCVLDFRM